MEQDIFNDYTQRITLARQQADGFKKLSDTYSLMRLGVFAAMGLVVYAGATLNNFSIIGISFVVLILIFTWLVSRQAKFDKQKNYFLALLKVNENEVNSILTHGNIYNNGQQFASDRHFYTADLDVFGNASLFQLINRAATALGINKLSSWLLAPAKKKIVELRQEAVNELAGKNDWKLDLQANLLFAAAEDTNQMKRLFVYLGAPLNLPGEKGLIMYIKAAPWLLFGALAGGYFYLPLYLVAIVLALINTAILTFNGSYILKSGDIAGKIGSLLANYALVFKKIENENWQSVKCKSLADDVKTRQTSKKIEELSKLINKLSASLIMVVGFILNTFFLWALKQVIAIEKWKRENHESLESAFDVIAEFEALISLAVPTINYPDWTVPTIAETEGYTLTVTNIAHPLIRNGSRVANDYELNNALHIDIITGSNMAGKSTFLRTIGINAVLALAGAKVCASAMEVSVVTMVSYMRIKDSLNESTSTFKAELDRLQMLLAAVENENRVFFLIDEMLRGTNSVDKYLGSKAVIEQLIAKKGVGMVATHDLQIARLEDKYPDYVCNYYFDIQVIDGEMLFDYKIKHGECKTFNASLLLKQIGIDVGPE